MKCHVIRDSTSTSLLIAGGCNIEFMVAKQATSFQATFVDRKC